MFGLIRVSVLVCVVVVSMFVGLAGLGLVGGLLWDAALGVFAGGPLPVLCLVGGLVACVGGVVSMAFGLERLDLV